MNLRTCLYPSTMERAFDLARSGQFPTIGALERKLRQEGYDQVVEHLSGPYTRQQLRSAIDEGCRSIRGPAPAPVSSSQAATA